MKTFILLLTIYGADGNETHILDSSMNGPDCLQGMQDFELAANRLGATVSCEFDYGAEWLAETNIVQ